MVGALVVGIVPGTTVLVGVRVGVDVRVGVLVTVGVEVLVGVDVGVLVFVGVGVNVDDACKNVTGDEPTAFAISTVAKLDTLDDVYVYVVALGEPTSTVTRQLLSDVIDIPLTCTTLLPSTVTVAPVQVLPSAPGISPAGN